MQPESLLARCTDHVFTGRHLQVDPGRVFNFPSSCIPSFPTAAAARFEHRLRPCRACPSGRGAPGRRGPTCRTRLRGGPGAAGPTAALSEAGRAEGGPGRRGGHVCGAQHRGGPQGPHPRCVFRLPRAPDGHLLQRPERQGARGALGCSGPGTEGTEGRKEGGGEDGSRPDRDARDPRPQTPPPRKRREPFPPADCGVTAARARGALPLPRLRRGTPGLGALSARARRVSGVDPGGPRL